jgi:hypothetical protein
MNASAAPFLKLVVDNTASRQSPRRPLEGLPLQQTIADRVTRFEDGAFQQYKATGMRESVDTAHLQTLSLAPGNLLQHATKSTLLAEEMTLRSGARLRVTPKGVEATAPDGRPLALPRGLDGTLDVGSGAVLEGPMPGGGHLTQEIDLDGTTRFVVHQNATVVTCAIAPDGSASIETRPSNGHTPAQVQRGQATQASDGKLAIVTRDAEPTMLVLQPFIRRDYYASSSPNGGRLLPADVSCVPREPYQHEATTVVTHGNAGSVFKRIEQTVDRFRPDAALLEHLTLSPGATRAFPSGSRVLHTRVEFSSGHTLETTHAKVSGKTLSMSRDGFHQNIHDSGTTLIEQRMVTRDGELQSYQYKIAPDGRAAVRPDNSMSWQSGLQAKELEDGRLLIESKNNSFTALIAPMVPLSWYATSMQGP